MTTMEAAVGGSRTQGAAGFSRLTVRGKGLAAVAALFAYLIIASLVVEAQRARMTDTVEELERAHAEEDGMARVNVSLAQAIVATNERYYRAGSGRDFSDVAVAVDAVHDGIAGLTPRFPFLAPVAAQLATRGANRRSAREREALL